MGKSTTAKLFADRGIPVWDADAAVERLYQKGGPAVQPVAAAFPSAVIDGSVSKEELKAIIAQDPTALKRLEAIVHPLVRDDRETFVNGTTEPIVVVDIPLLFETGSAKEFDMVVVVSAPPDVQKERVLARPNMTMDQFELIRSKQTPDAEKRSKADLVILTHDMPSATQGVELALKIARGRIQNA